MAWPHPHISKRDIDLTVMIRTSVRPSPILRNADYSSLLNIYLTLVPPVTGSRRIQRRKADIAVERSKYASRHWLRALPCHARIDFQRSAASEIRPLLAKDVFDGPLGNSCVNSSTAVTPANQRLLEWRAMIEPAKRDVATAASPPDAVKARVLPVALAVIAAMLLVYWPMLAGQIVFLRDSALWVFPARWFVRQSLLAGEFPSWNPYQGLGFPLLADPQYGVFYPPHWLFLLVSDGILAHLVSWLSLAHLVWGGIGMMLLARRLGACRFGATVAGLSWALSGHTTSAWSIGPLLLGEAWIPWVARGFLILSSREGRVPLVSAVWPMALSLLVGEPFMSAMALFFAVVVVLAAGKGLPSTRSAIVATARSASAWIIAVTIAAVSWLPPLRMLGTTERAQAFSREAAELYSHHPLRVLEMVAPGALGDPTGEYPAGRWVGEPGAAGAPLFFSSYLGVLSLAFVLFGLRMRRLQGVLAGAALLALFVAFGKHAPVHEVWRRILFPFAHMHSPEKYVVLVVAPLSLLSGLGASNLLAARRPALQRFFFLAGALAALALVAGRLLPVALVSDMRWAALRGLLLLGLLLALALLLRHYPRVASFAILALVAIDLGIPANRLAGFASAARLMRVPPAASAVLEDNRNNLAPPRIFREPNLEQNAAPLVPHATWQDSEDLAISALTPNTLNIFGLAAVPGYASAIPDQLTRLDPRSYAELVVTLRLLSVPYALVADAAADEILATSSATLLSRALPGGKLLRMGGVLPRVYLPSQARAISPAQAAQRLRDESVVSGREVLLFAEDALALVHAAKESAGQECKLQSFTNTRIVAQCTTLVPNLVVFIEQYDPGWKATVDGNPVPILPANLVMRAVPIPAGKHHIELEYQTPGLSLAILLSILGLLALAATSFLSRKMGRTREAALFAKL